MRGQRLWWIWPVLGGLAGAALGIYLGTLVSDRVVGPAAFGPLGLALGAAAGTYWGLRLDVRPEDWRWMVAAVATALAAGFVVWFSVGGLEALAVLLWALTVGVVVWLVGRLRQ